jgi:hypothetical protein
VDVGEQFSGFLSREASRHCPRFDVIIRKNWGRLVTFGFPNMRADVLVALAMAFVIGFALGYAVRAAISFGRRRAAMKRRYSF